MNLPISRPEQLERLRKIRDGEALADTPVADASITAAKLATGAVTTAKLATLAVDAAAIAANAVTTTKILDGALTADATGRAKVADSFVNAAKIEADAVTTVKILDSNVTTAKVATGAISTAKLAAGAGTLPKVDFTGLKILAGSGVAAAGPIALTGAAVGDRVIGVFGVPILAGVLLAPAAGVFEATITVTNQVQQASASNLTANAYIFLLAPPTA